MVDIALWDLLGHVDNVPIYKLLESIPTYTRTPLLSEIPSDLQKGDERFEQRFGAVKFHASVCLTKTWN